MGEQLLPRTAPVHSLRRFLARLHPARRTPGGDAVGGLGAMAVVGAVAILATAALVLGIIAVWPTQGQHPRTSATRPPEGAVLGAEGRPDVMAPGAGPLTGRLQPPGTTGGATDEARVRLGQPARVGTWEVAVRRTDLREFAAADGLSSPGRGERVLEAQVTVTNDGAAPADPGLDLLVGYLGPDGVEYNGDAGGVCPTREAVFGRGKIPPGETVRGSVCLGVPARAVEGGAWVLRTPAEYARPKVFAAR
ncbi:hypothetical protein [Georgenia thermotolerans]|uniref:DUF4352 domain-containing protein n=1 Tax=Georgenia thermotolerans TaxID=527326 RepID=A0A7J5US63_9MICO|nr:hypothetical protein [Georgenia thermotolerans]KAE8765158.1 hypothetical protein GB883_05545 [Georgenia thermotolerans]